MLTLKDIGYSVKPPKESSASVKPARAFILEHISLTFRPGTITAITGPNGSGKSTLAEIIMGIKKPTTGRILQDRVDITDQDITERAKGGLAYAFQQPVRFKGLSVGDLINIASGELISPEEQSNYLLDVGLNPTEYLTRETSGKLSGGELKRIEIATILARKSAKYLIFDEPEAGIDLWSFASLVKIFQRLRRAGKAIIIISHQEKILQIADTIVILEHGKIKSKGASATILSKITGDQS